MAVTQTSRALHIFQVTAAAACLIGVYGPAMNACAARRAAEFLREPIRTVIDNERGSIFTTPVQNGWSALGAYVGAPKSDKFVKLDMDAIKIVQARFHLIKPSDDTTWAWFPYSEFKQYEREEIAAGHEPLLITAQYEGISRPVLWSWSLGFVNNGEAPKYAAQQWEQAVSVADDRFIRFWINRYVRRIVLAGMAGASNLWIGLDESAFNPDLYGVLDDHNRFRGPIKWDPPFPQTEEAYYDSLRRFFAQVTALAPEIKLMCNIGSMKDWSRFDSVFENVPGVMVEELFRSDPSSYVRLVNYRLLASLSRFAAKGRVAILRTTTPDDPTRIGTAYSAYQLVKGPNCFFAPRLDQTIDEVPADRYATQRDRLGAPTAQMETLVAPGALNDGYRLYWREYEGGLVYLNLSGFTRIVELPKDNVYVDRTGTPVKSLVLSDMTGDYVVLQHNTLTGFPHISPRFQGFVSGPLSVAVAPGCNGLVRYTTDGRQPDDSSTPYTGAIVLTTSAIMRARCYDQSNAPSSFSSTALFAVTPDAPALSLREIPPGPMRDTFYPEIAVQPQSSGDITVTYRVGRRSEIGCGTTEAADITGQVIIPRGSHGAFIPIAISDAQRVLNAANLQVCLVDSDLGSIAGPALYYP